MNKLALLALAIASILLAGCAAPSTPDPKIAYIYDSVDSGTTADVTAILGGYDVTMIDHTAVTVTAGMLAGYDLVIVADQENPWDYTTALSNAIINAGKPVIAMGYAGPYFYNNQNVVTINLKSVGSGGGFTLTKTDATDAIWSTPHTIADASAVTTAFTGWTSAAGTVFFGVTLANWPTNYTATTHALSVAKHTSGSDYHIIAREADKYMLWGIVGSIDDLSQAGKDLFANAVYAMLH